MGRMWKAVVTTGEARRVTGQVMGGRATLEGDGYGCKEDGHLCESDCRVSGRVAPRPSPLTVVSCPIHCTCPDRQLRRAPPPWLGEVLKQLLQLLWFSLWNALDPAICAALIASESDGAAAASADPVAKAGAQGRRALASAEPRMDLDTTRFSSLTYTVSAS